jgi:ribosome modulation factor
MGTPRKILEIVREMGREAALAGARRDMCPHDKRGGRAILGPLRRAWIGGWKDGKEEKVKR